MKPGFSEIFEGAGALWRGNADLLARVAAVFFFLPLFAARLFLAMPEMGGEEQTIEQTFEILRAWYTDNALWLTLAFVWQGWGMATVLVLLIDPARPELGRAMVQALTLLPLLVAAWILAGLLIAAGAFLLIVPGFYMMGRTFIVGATFVGGSSRNPFTVVARGIALTRGNGWKLFFVSFVVSAIASVLGALVDPDAAHSTSMVGAVFALLGSAIATVAALTMLLLQVSAYRLLSDSKGM